MVREVLNALVLEADRCGLLTPLPGAQLGKGLSLYADDLVIFVNPSREDFGCISAILDLFAGASGLLSNLDKCLISPIRCSQEHIDAVREVFPC